MRQVAAGVQTRLVSSRDALNQPFQLSYRPASQEEQFHGDPETLPEAASEKVSQTGGSGHSLPVFYSKGRRLAEPHTQLIDFSIKASVPRLRRSVPMGHPVVMFMS